tara:strand:+ start:26 stop:301 length:276 start_codon:yes stop_codon:yes gene_type:complete
MKLVRFTSGEEVIGKVIDRKDTIEISEAYSIVATEPGKMGFIPFMAYTKADKGLEINKQFVMFVVDPVDELVDQVRSMNSGIVVPEQKLVT